MKTKRTQYLITSITCQERRRRGDGTSIGMVRGCVHLVEVDAPLTASSSKSVEGSLLQWLNTFEELLSAPIASLEELADGIVLHRICSDISPAHFPPDTLQERCGSNAIMRATNVRRLLRALEQYYREALAQGIELDADFIDPAAVAKGDAPAVCKLVEMVLGCAVQVVSCRASIVPVRAFCAQCSLYAVVKVRTHSTARAVRRKASLHPAGDARPRHT